MGILISFLLFFSSHGLFAQEAHFGKLNLKPAKKITSVGSNRHPLYVSDSSIIYVSKSRRQHKDPQIYFKDLKTGKEKRITHQRGQLSNGFYVSSAGEIIYSSSTDEEKEIPYVLRKHGQRYPTSVKNDAFFQIDFTPQEIYQSKIDGSDILRLTHSPGYDGSPTLLASKKRLYFSRWSKGKLTLFAKSLSKNLAAWRVTSTHGHDLGLQASPNEKKFVWNRFSPDFKSSQVLMSDLNFKNPQYLTLDTGVNWSPTWHPKGESIIYSAKAANQRHFDLFEVSTDGECKRQITSFNGDEFFPSVSPNGQHIVFTSTQSGVEQIYKVDYPDSPLCDNSRRQ